MGKLRISVINREEQPSSTIRSDEAAPDSLTGRCALCDGPRWPPLDDIGTYDVYFAVVNAAAPCAANREVFRRDCEHFVDTQQVPSGWAVHPGVDATSTGILWMQFFGALKELGAELRCVGVMARPQKGVLET